jgi:hypothetical protein
MLSINAIVSKIEMPEVMSKVVRMGRHALFLPSAKATSKNPI